MTRVEILCSSRELFGADRSALRLSEALISLGLTVELVMPADRPELGLSDEAARRGILTREERIAVASSRGVESPLALLPGRPGRPAADLTIFNSTAVLGSASRVARKVVVVREWLEPRSLRHRALVARHRMGADAVVGVSSGVLSQWSKCTHGPPHRHVVHNWLSRSALDAAEAEESDTERDGILCIGRFNRWKGQDVLAAAYEEAFKDNTARPRLRFVGAQPGTEFDARAESLADRGRAEGWEVLPFTSNPTGHFRSAALVVVPSMQPEPFGTVVLEAISHGCRVLAFDQGGPTDMAADFPGILELVRRDTSCLAGALRTWWDEGGKALTAQESSAGRGTLESRYSPEAGIDAWRTVIDGLAS